MACGSGSFLLGAYQCLLDHCSKWYLDHKPNSHKRAVFEDPRDKHWRLTIEEKKRILTTHVFGVDIDPQAVEVTKLSLLLKALEGENDATMALQLRLFHERALPNLADNIKCGNSLIGPDYFTGKLITDTDDLKRVKPFDWNAGFPHAMKAGGFGCVIGNPPYIFTRNQGILESEKAYYYSHFEHHSTQLNMFGLFLEKAYSLLPSNGRAGFIVPNNWLTIDTFAPLRRFVIHGTADVEVTNVLDRVFNAADVDTCVVSFRKAKPTRLTVAEMKGEQVVFQECVAASQIVPPGFIVQIGLLKDARSQQLIAKIDSVSKPLAQFASVSTGLKAYQTGKGKPRQTSREKTNRVFHAKKKIDASYGRYLDGVDVCRYRLGWSGEWLSYGDWLAEPRRSVPFDGERILVRQIPAGPPYLVHATIATGKCYHDINSMVVFRPQSGTSLKYILGIINSRLVSFWFQKKYDKLQRKIFPQFKVKELAAFPMPAIDPADRPAKLRTTGLLVSSKRCFPFTDAVPWPRRPSRKPCCKTRSTRLIVKSTGWCTTCTT